MQRKYESESYLRETRIASFGFAYSEQRLGLQGRYGFGNVAVANVVNQRDDSFFEDLLNNQLASSTF